MAKIYSREQYIKRARQIRFFEKVIFKARLLFPFGRNKSSRKQVFIETDFGRVRTLWYGFEKKDPAPVFFDLHGGGFVLGSADMDESMNIGLEKQAGCKIISIDYAKAPDHPYPAAVNQIYAVIKHVYEYADKYSIDPKKMSIGGYSAGANLSTVICMKAKKEGEFQFVCQVLDYPPVDLATSYLDKPQPTGSISPQMAFMFNASYIDPTQAKDPYVSPVYALEEELKGLPPALFILAGGDSLHDEGLKYNAMLRTCGVITECYEYPNAPHGFTYKPSEDTADALEKMGLFLKKYLK